MSGAADLDPRLSEAALEIGRRLLATTEPTPDGCTWQAEVMTGIEDERPLIAHGEIGAALYDGTAGVGIALAACAAAAPPKQSARFAEAAGAAVRQSLAEASALQPGLFDGATGIALAAETVGRSCGDEELRASGRELALTVADDLAAGNGSAGIDLTAGLAGIVLGLQAVLGQEAPRAALRAAASQLSAAAVPQAWGSAWPGEDGRPPLLGFSHGAAGIALALGELATAEEDAEFDRACAEGIEYERGWFDPYRVAWPDLRNHDPAMGEPDSWTAAWCHGALGIGLSRLRLFQLRSDPVLAAEASAALQGARSLVVGAGTSLRAGTPSDCTLCHGLGGAVELMLVAGRALDVPDHAGAARRTALLLLAQREAAGTWPCGLPGAGEIPGLMMGTAGIALTLLRAAGSTAIPSPLLPGPSGM